MEKKWNEEFNYRKKNSESILLFHTIMKSEKETVLIFAQGQITKTNEYNF